MSGSDSTALRPSGAALDGSAPSPDGPPAPQPGVRPTQPDARPEHHREQLGSDLRSLGVREGDTVLVHSSLREFGYVAGGARTVVRSLLDVLGEAGTLVVPAFTANNSDPSRWARTCNRPVPAHEWPAIRERMLPFDPALTPSHRVGAVAEAVRTWPGAVRSGHPQSSFAAVGASARPLLASHPLNCHLGPESPLGALNQMDAKVLLLGVSFAVCTAFHLAEYHIEPRGTREYECVVNIDGRRQWYRYRDVVLDDADFQSLGAAFEASPVGAGIRRGTVGCAEGRLFRVPDAVTFARSWMAKNRAE